MSFVTSLAHISLAQTPTPLEAQPKLLSALLGPRSDVRSGADWPSLFIKRDDLTGVSVTGNKVRKLELLVAEAKQRGADTLITCGGVQSNHCRATAAVAAQQGMRSLLFLRNEGVPPSPSGNLLLDRLLGAEVRFISRAAYQDRTRILTEAAYELAQQGRHGYVIPEGGSNGLGCLGYLRCIDELREQVPNPEQPLTIVSAVGSGGTLAGLILGALLYDLPWRVVGINVCDSRDYFVERIAAILREAALILKHPVIDRAMGTAESLIDIRDGYVGRGYALSQPSELQLLAEIAQRSGILLDPVYTGKAFCGFLGELRKASNGLGERVVFLHSGGIFGLLAAAAELARILTDA
jgi:D-cysteine desulfhydrase